MFPAIQREINDIRSSIPQLPPEVDLSDIHNSLSELEKKIPEMPEQKDIETPIQELRDWVEEEHKKLDEKIKTMAVGKGGGGTNARGVRHAFKYIANTEAPVGDIDGANTTYTVSKEIFWIVGFTLNGEQIAELPNFTYDYKTITFGTALPAAYSGKDFEIKYIG